MTDITAVLQQAVAARPRHAPYRLQLGPRLTDYIERAVAEATRRSPTVNVSVFDFVRDTLLLRYPPGADKVERAERRHSVMRFQQTTGPVTATGVDPNPVSDAAVRKISRFPSAPVALLERERSS
jgi:(1->4)-alpha-D-glucan 1-alpha-D-glucosylmutase